MVLLAEKKTTMDSETHLNLLPETREDLWSGHPGSERVTRRPPSPPPGGSGTPRLTGLDSWLPRHRAFPRMAHGSALGGDGEWDCPWKWADRGWPGAPDGIFSKFCWIYFTYLSRKGPRENGRPFLTKDLGCDSTHFFVLTQSKWADQILELPSEPVGNGVRLSNSARANSPHRA